MIELSARPRSRCVARCAESRETGSHVIRIAGFVEIGQMAASAIRRRAGELSSHVTLIAGHIDMRAGEGEFGRGVVIEGRPRP